MKVLGLCVLLCIASASAFSYIIFPLTEVPLEASAVLNAVLGAKLNANLFVANLNCDAQAYVNLKAVVIADLVRVLVSAKPVADVAANCQLSVSAYVKLYVKALISEINKGNHVCVIANAQLLALLEANVDFHAALKSSQNKVAIIKVDLVPIATANLAASGAVIVRAVDKDAIAILRAALE